MDTAALIRFCEQTAAAAPSATAQQQQQQQQQLFAAAKNVLQFAAAGAGADLAKTLENLCAAAATANADQQPVVLALVVEAAALAGPSLPADVFERCGVDALVVDAINRAAGADEKDSFASVCVARLALQGRVPFNQLLEPLLSQTTTVIGGLPRAFALDVLGQVVRSMSLPDGAAADIFDAALRLLPDEECGGEVARRLLGPLLHAASPAVQQPARRTALHTAVVALAATQGREAAALLVIAGLFEHLFVDGAGVEHDLRFSSALWELLLRALRRVSAFGESPAVRDAVHNRAIYLLKRIVSLTSGEDMTGSDAQAQKRGGGGGAKKPEKGKTNGASTSGAAAAAAATAAPDALRYFDAERRFLWNDSRKALFVGKWQTFFVVWEALSEFSTHICEPALQSLARDVLGAAEHVVPTEMVEALFAKAFHHGNAGVRRLALHTLWSHAGADAFSDAFLAASLQVADASLCQEADRALILSGSALLSSAITACEPAHAAPVLSTVARVSRFMCGVAGKRGPQRVDGFLRALVAAATHDTVAPRFSTAVFCRVFRDVAASVRSNSSDLGGIISAATYTALQKFVVSNVHSKHVAWLEARFCALLVEAAVLLHGAAPSAAPEMTAVTAAFQQFLLIAGPLGEGGGSTQGPVDAVGVVLPLGGAVPSAALRRMMRGAGILGKAVEPRSFIMQPHLELDVAALKSLCFFSADLLPSVACVIEQIDGCGERVAAGFGPVARAAALLGELCSLDDDAVNAQVRGAAASLVRNLTTVAQRILIRPDATVGVEAFDALCSALFWVCRLDLGRAPNSAAAAVDWPALWHACGEILAASLSTTSGENDLDAVWQRHALRFVQAAAAAAALGCGPGAVAPFHGPAAAASASRLARLLLTVPPLRVADGTIAAQHFKATWTSTLVFLEGCGRDGLDAALLVAVAERALEQLDCAASTAMSSVFEVLAFVLQCERAPADLCARVAVLLRRRIADGYRRERLRCAAIYCAAVGGCRALSLGEHVLPLLDDGEYAQQRVPLFVALAVTQRYRIIKHAAAAATAATSAASAAEHGELLGALVHIAVHLSVEVGDTEESEAAFAAVEPPLLVQGGAWAQSLCTELFPPATRLVSVARAIAIVALHDVAARGSAAAAADLVHSLIDIAERATGGKGDARDAVMVNSAHHRTRLRCWQVIASLARYVPRAAWGGDSGLVARLLKRSLHVVNSPVIRNLIEETTLCGLRADGAATIPLLLAALNPDARPFVTASLLTIVAALLLRAPPGAGAYAPQFVSVLEQHSTSHQHIIRLIAALALIDFSKKQDAHAPLGTVGAYIVGNQESIKLYDKNGAASSTRFLVDDLRFVFSVQRLDGGQWLHDVVPWTCFQRAVTSSAGDLMRSVLGATTPFEIASAQRIGTAAAVSSLHPSVLEAFGCAGSGDAASNASSASLYLDMSEVEAAAAAAATATEKQQETEAAAVDTGSSGGMTLQRKTAPWWQSSVHDEVAPRNLGVKVKQNITVVASLLDQPVNVAGIFRSAEIFGAQRVVLGAASVLQHPHFVAAARSAELWIDHQIVPRGAELLAYLRSMQQQGHAVIAVEQTSDSVVLGEFTFPREGRGIVLVLGAEQQGVPADVLMCCDAFVEVPQLGVLRSLNVSSCTSIVLYEITRQKLAAEK